MSGDDAKGKGERKALEEAERKANEEADRNKAEKQLISAEERRADAELRRDSAENQRELCEHQRTTAEAMRADVETKRAKAEEAREANAQRIRAEAQDAATKALNAAAEAHSAANAIHSSVLESPKIQGAPDTPYEQKDRPRWENLPEDPEAEKASIIAFHDALKKAGWQYSLRDIVRFHTSVRCEPLTILGGAPGSGKSSLARMYASYFGFGETKRFLAVDVQPSWHDRMDFLGFVKTHGDKPEFVDAETGVADFLRKAAEDSVAKDKDPKGLWLACLEEINLARPEHYFSDFLQRVSLDDSERGENPIVFRGLSGDEVKKGTFKLVPSVRFVGTCNFDETTQNFSARFLDRCHYIELQSVSLQDMFFPADRKDVVFPQLNWKWRPFSSTQRKRTESRKIDISSLLKREEEQKGKREESAKKVTIVLDTVLKNLGIFPSPRVVDGIVRYVEARLDTVNEEFEEERSAKRPDTSKDLFSRALDEAFLQRMLPKLFIVQSGFPNADSDDLRKDLKNALSPGKNNIKLHLCNWFLEKPFFAR